EIELDVAAAPVELKAALALAPRSALAALHDRQIPAQIVVAHAAHQCERLFEPALGVVVEEQPADAPCLAAVREEEVLVAGLLEARVEVGPEGLAGVARLAVPVHAVLVERVVRREVEAPAEPPGRRVTLGAE